ncbi:SRR1 domain-containing protein [Mycena chlorophos]|uniref:SRR1 domain-containing protein n=1 Tax=Mycena chlorophos TaxID=658473 RepID=A0A8H6WKV2_MYCCL|nr:SRR1 domain-containing protein [Mycena chlorophos]
MPSTIRDSPVQPAPWVVRLDDLWRASTVMGTIGFTAGSIGGAIPRVVEAGVLLHRSSAFPLTAYQLIRFGALSTGLGLGVPFALIPSGIQLLHQLDFHAEGKLQFGHWRASYDDAAIIPLMAAFMGALVALPVQMRLEKRLEGKGLRMGGRADVAGYAFAVMILALGRRVVSRAQIEATN